MYNVSSQLLVSKYQLYLLNEDELRKVKELRKYSCAFASGPFSPSGNRECQEVKT
jgi:hypothetical protein